MEIGGVKIDYLGHDGFAFVGENGKVIVVDPYNVSERAPKADLILVTHSHYDHCSINDIRKVAKEGTIVVIPADAQSKITRIDGVQMEIAEVGDEFSFWDVKIEAVAAYNLETIYHPKQEGWMGFVVKFGNVIIYHAGDTDRIPEMERLTGYGKRENKFVAILPVSGKYVMGAREAAEVAGFLSPTVAIPMHYGAGVAGTAEDAREFIELCKEKNISAEILPKL